MQSTTDSPNIAEGGRPVSLFALLIGINNYERPHRYHALRGAVNDVMLFKQYLETNLGIPSSQINMLCNEAATRTAVLRALKNLVTDKRIQRDDAIVIYFAGHGVEIDAPPSWECSDPARKIQCIAPYDFFDGPGRRVHAIPDRTINHLLASISEQHGQNIVSDYRSRVQKPLISGQTVIFDCCHSASGTRNQNTSTTDESLVARSINLELTGYPDDLDKDIFDHDISPVSEGESKRAPRHLPEFKHNGLRSHVLLAACGIKEDAHEGSVILPHLENGAKRCGLFSAALLQLLYRVPHHQITYANILNQLNKIEGQNPQCEGLHKNRPLFGAKILSESVRRSFKVSYNPGDPISKGYYIIAAGKIHQITDSTEFTVYYENDITLSRPLGVLRVTNLRPFEAVAQPTSVNGGVDLDISLGPLIAVATTLSHSEKLQVWVDPSVQHIYQRISHGHANKLQNVNPTDIEKMAEIRIKCNPQKRIFFEIFTSPKVLQPPLSFMWRKDNILADDGFLAFALSEASDFYSELKRPDNEPQLSAKIDVEFFELDRQMEEDADLGSRYVMNPIDYQNIYRNGLIYLNMSDSGDDSKAYYGLKLTNRTGLGLYVNVYMFMNADLSIVPLVKTDMNTPYNLDVSLPATVKDIAGEKPGTLAIGYGASGYIPFSFKLPPGVQHDVDFVKIYLTTYPVDLSYLIQPCPFIEAEHRGIKKHTQRRPPMTWSHIVIPIVQQRRNAHHM